MCLPVSHWSNPIKNCRARNLVENVKLCCCFGNNLVGPQMVGHSHMIQQIPLPRYIYPKEMKTFVHTKMCTQVFMAASFVMAQNDEWSISWWMVLRPHSAFRNPSLTPSPQSVLLHLLCLHSHSSLCLEALPPCLLLWKFHLSSRPISSGYDDKDAPPTGLLGGWAETMWDESACE